MKPVSLLLVFLFTCVTSAGFTWLACRVAPRFGLVDKPDGRRKLHGRTTPLGGGLAVLMSSALAIGLVLLAPSLWGHGFTDRWSGVIGLFAGCVIIAAVGVLDDRYTLRGRFKLTGQVIAVIPVMLGGLVIPSINVCGWQIELGLLAVPFTLFWMLGAINAINFLDGIDGLAATLGVVISVAIAVMAAMGGHPTTSAVALIFAGSLVGFLVFNLPPAKIFLGDAGSMLIGLVTGALAIRASVKGPGTVLLAAPVAMLMLPILDSVAAIVRRRLSGRTVFSTDRAHLHHRLLDRLGSPARTVAVIGICCAVTSVAGLVGIAIKSDLVALFTCAALLVIVVTTGIFGRAEFMLLLSRMHKMLALATRPSAREGRGAHVTKVHLQGSRDWSVLWDALTEYAEKMSLTRLHLNLNMPFIREGLNAEWENPNGVDRERLWQIEFPLMVAGHLSGRLAIAGHRGGQSMVEELSQLVDLLEPFQIEFETLPGNGAAPSPKETAETPPRGSRPKQSVLVK